jgi:hypothetical protein
MAKRYCVKVSREFCATVEFDLEEEIENKATLFEVARSVADDLDSWSARSAGTSNGVVRVTDIDDVDPEYDATEALGACRD